MQCPICIGQGVIPHVQQQNEATYRSAWPDLCERCGGSGMVMGFPDPEEESLPSPEPSVSAARSILDSLALGGSASEPSTATIQPLPFPTLSERLPEWSFDLISGCFVPLTVCGRKP